MLLKLGDFSVDYFNILSPLVERYDAFLVDIWGVLHDSVNAYPGAVECLRKLKENKKKIILVSNAARRSALLASELSTFGITGQMFDQIVSSGELTWHAFSSGQDERLQALGSRFFLLGSEKYGLTDGLPLVHVQEVGDADFLFAIGVIGNPSTTADSENVLQKAAEKGLPMVCANPDLKVVRDGVMGIAPGALAERYQELGGSVIYFGKPDLAVYQRCFELLPGIEKSRIVAVGDALKTDIAGGIAAGIDSILVATGIHQDILKGFPFLTDQFRALCQFEKKVPTIIINRFTW